MLNLTDSSSVSEYSLVYIPTKQIPKVLLVHIQTIKAMLIKWDPKYGYERSGVFHSETLKELNVHEQYVDLTLFLNKLLNSNIGIFPLFEWQIISDWFGCSISTLISGNYPGLLQSM